MFGRGCRAGTVIRVRVLASGPLRLFLLAGLVGCIAGCGSRAVAPVHSIGKLEITAPEPKPGPRPEAEPEPERAYLVASGDTVYSIAWRHGVDYRALARFNSIRDPFTIYPGQRLRIPGPGDAAAPASKAGAAVAGPAGPAVVSTRGTGAQDAPLPKPVPLPEPSSIAKAKSPAPAPVPASKAPAGPQPGAARPETAASSTPAAVPPLATREVAGLSWSRPTRGKAVGRFGRGGNKGVDIAGEFEQPIRAASRGRVVYAGSGLVGYGKLVIVKHNSRLLSAYAHNERLQVKEGDDVKRGQHIADMGRSAKGKTILHFEIRRDGKPVDPLRYLP